MSWELIALIAIMTYGSRMVALTLLPPMPPMVATVLDRMPPILFAGLAAQALISPQGVATAPALAAAAGALVAVPARSLLLCLIAGLVGYGIGSIIGG